MKWYIVVLSKKSIELRKKTEDVVHDEFDYLTISFSYYTWHHFEIIVNYYVLPKSERVTEFLLSRISNKRKEMKKSR